MRNLILFLAIVLTITTALYAKRSTPALVDSLPPRDDSAAARVVVVYQEGDCDGSLAGLQLLRRSSLRGQIAFDAVFVGTSEAMAESIDRLAAGGVKLTAVRFGSTLRSQLLPLGYHATPFLVVLDRKGRVRLTAPLPEDMAGMSTLVDILNRMNPLELEVSG